MITRQSLRVRAKDYVRVTRWLAILIMLGGLLMPPGRSDASVVAPQDFATCRTVSSLDARGIFSSITYVGELGTALAHLRFVLKPQHRMVCLGAVHCPSDPSAFTFDTMRYRVALSTNILSVSTLAPDPSNPGCPLQGELLSQVLNNPSVLRVKIYFQENFATMGVNPKRQTFDLGLPARFPGVVPDGTEINLFDAGFQITVVEDPIS